MARKYHTNILHSRHREGGAQNTDSHKTPERKLKDINQLFLPSETIMAISAV